MAKEKVLAGMSGGVDSSVCAALLLEGGLDTAGATLKLHDCGSPTDAEDARAVCERLGIPHYVFTFKEEFEETVIDNFISEYLNGRTPNPCVVCNRLLKFGKMLRRAQELGFNKIATGHYAKISKAAGGRYLLTRPADREKDQTYVLYSLTQEQLSKTLFPLGELTKSAVRGVARKHGFVNAAKPDSQDICFVPNGDYAGFIEHFSGKCSPHGDFVDAAGNRLGEHKGIIRYTVGQRKGLGIALGKPAFVLEKRVDDNTVVLGDEDELFYRCVLADRLNFIPFDGLTTDLRVTAKLRYRHAEQPAILHPLGDDRVLIEFDKPQRAPAAGQSAVFYDGDVVVGGGTILKGYSL